ncbi:hypothetical protein PWT90_06044 [Aphanocladium album]|nr:hypothetical protein PWT90_06044 [Aphanocladium album]
MPVVHAGQILADSPEVPFGTLAFDCYLMPYQERAHANLVNRIFMPEKIVTRCCVPFQNRQERLAARPDRHTVPLVRTYYHAAFAGGGGGGEFLPSASVVLLDDELLYEALTAEEIVRRIPQLLDERTVSVLRDMHSGGGGGRARGRGEVLSVPVPLLAEEEEEEEEKGALQRAARDAVAFLLLADEEAMREEALKDRAEEAAGVVGGDGKWGLVRAARIRERASRSIFGFSLTEKFGGWSGCGDDCSIAWNGKHGVTVDTLLPKLYRPGSTRALNCDVALAGGCSKRTASEEAGSPQTEFLLQMKTP